MLIGARWWGARGGIEERFNRGGFTAAVRLGRACFCRLFRQKSKRRVDGRLKRKLCLSCGAESREKRTGEFCQMWEDSVAFLAGLTSLTLLPLVTCQ